MASPPAPPTPAASYRPTPEEVIVAARSLYTDELKPFGRILLKRIRELACVPSAAGPAKYADAESVPLVDPKYLRKVCESCPAFNIEPAEGREYAVTFIGEPGIFVDANSVVDPYPAHLWDEAARYFEGLEVDDCRLPCGRYACAQVLVARKLRFLRGKSLGEVCHIVQLAISQRKLLGYLEGHTVPYARSEECAKQRCAVRQQPFAGPEVAPSAVPFASWEDLRNGLRWILENSCNPSPGTITLSNVKRLFRSQLGLELSETVLGHSRVCDLLQDPRLRDICTVQVLGYGQALVQVVFPQFPSHSSGSTMAPAAAPRLPPSTTMPGLVSSCASTRSLFSTAPGNYYGLPPVSPMSAAEAPLTIFPMSAPSWPCPPPPMEPTFALPEFAAPYWEAPLAFPDLPFPDVTVPFADVEVAAPAAPSASASRKHVATDPTITPPGSSLGGDDFDDTCSAVSAAISEERADSEASATSGSLSPKLAKAGLVVRNTFIEVEDAGHVELAVSSPKRSRSLPRGLRLGRAAATTRA